jgi:Predicted methylated DNA-protein cysteine methyltransferase
MKKDSHIGKNKGLFERVYALVRIIPEGKVMTYGQVALALGLRDVRKIGWALHANKDVNTPCHRVVNKEGGLAPNYAFGGAEVQKKRLEEEGVKFIGDKNVDLEKSLWKMTN